MIVRAQRVCRLGGLRLRLQFFGESHKQFDPAAFHRQLPLQRMNAWCVESNVADRRFWEVTPSISEILQLVGQERTTASSAATPGREESEMQQDCKMYCLDRPAASTESRVRKIVPVMELLRSRRHKRMLDVETGRSGAAQERPEDHRETEGKGADWQRSLLDWRLKFQEDCGLCFTVLQAEREELMAQELLFAAEDVLLKEEKATSERGAESIKNRELRVGILCGASHIAGITAFLNRYLRSDSFWARNKESLPLLYGCASRAEVEAGEEQDESHEQATQSATAGGEAAEAVACPLIFADPRVDVRVRRNQLLHAAENNLPVENAPVSRWRIGAGTPTLLLGYTIVAGSFFYVSYQVDMWLFSKKMARLEATEAANAHRVVE